MGKNRLPHMKEIYVIVISTRRTPCTINANNGCVREFDGTPGGCEDPVLVTHCAGSFDNVCKLCLPV